MHTLYVTGVLSSTPTSAVVYIFQSAEYTAELPLFAGIICLMGSNQTVAPPPAPP